MRTQYTLLIATLIISVTLIPGCGVLRPENMPQTVPCSITVLQSGKPMADVDVNLFRVDGNGALSIGGKTDANGVAKITTAWGNYKTDGAPVGVCKITVDKNFEMPPPPKTSEAEPNWSPEQWDKYESDYNAEIDKRRIIPRRLTESATTPFEITIVEKTGGTITIDVAK